MSPLVMIAGLAVNQDGDPVPNVQIQPSEEAQNSSFDKRYVGYFNIKTTDGGGQFRLFTPPGKYYWRRYHSAMSQAVQRRFAPAVPPFSFMTALTIRTPPAPTLRQCWK